MTINGLPAHALILHAAVVLGPIAALMAIAYVAVPRFRTWARWPMVVLAVVAALSVVASYLSGRNFLDSRPELAQLPAIQTHQERAAYALWITIGFALVAAVVGWRHATSGRLRIGGDVLLGVLAVGSLVAVVLTGDAGAKAVWG